MPCATLRFGGVSEEEEWEALLTEALIIPESAAEKQRRLMHLHRDILHEAPPECLPLADKVEQAMRAIHVGT
jgi:hypothetical protein